MPRNKPPVVPQPSRSIQIWQKNGGNVGNDGLGGQPILLNSELAKPLNADSFLEKQIMTPAGTKMMQRVVPILPHTHRPLINDPGFKNQLQHFINKNSESLPFFLDSNKYNRQNTSLLNDVVGGNSYFENKVRI